MEIFSDDSKSARLDVLAARVQDLCMFRGICNMAICSVVLQEYLVSLFFFFWSFLVTVFLMTAGELLCFIAIAEAGYKKGRPKIALPAKSFYNRILKLSLNVLQVQCLLALYDLVITKGKREPTD
jgi:hypothetical protein